MSVVGVAGWKRTFSFNVLEGDDITSNVDPTSEIEPFLRCPVSGFGPLSIFKVD